MLCNSFIITGLLDLSAFPGFVRSRFFPAQVFLHVCLDVIRYIIGSLSKPRRRRQRERHKTKGLISKTISVHVRYESLYISLPSSAKQQREMSKFCVVYETWTTTANFSYFQLELNAVVAYLAYERF